MIRISASTAIATLGLTALALTGCSAADEKPRKGKYKPSVELTAFEIPGAPASARAQAEAGMKSSMAGQLGGEACVGGGGSPSEWKKLSEQLSKSLGGTCTTARDASTATSIDTVLKCTGTQMGDVTATITGQAEAESFRMDVNFALDKLPNNMGKGKLGMRITATRTGDC